MSLSPVAGMFRLEHRDSNKACALVTNKKLDREVASRFTLRIKAVEASRMKRAGMSSQISQC